MKSSDKCSPLLLQLYSNIAEPPLKFAHCNNLPIYIKSLKSFHIFNTRIKNIYHDLLHLYYTTTKTLQSNQVKRAPPKFH